MSDDLLELLAAAPAPGMSIDPYAAMATGRRNRTRRRVITSLAAAAVVALAVGGWALSGFGRDRALPAGSGVELVTINPLAFGPASTLPVQGVEVSFDRTTGVATFTTVTDGKEVEVGTVTVTDPAAGRMSVSREGTTPMILAVTPVDQTDADRPTILPRSAAPQVTGWSGTELLPKSGRTAYVLGFTTHDAALKVTTLVWEDPLHGMAFSDGTSVRSVRFPGPLGGSRVIFISQQHKVVGVSVPTDAKTTMGETSTAPLPADGVGLFPGVTGQTTGTTSTTTFACLFGLLPQGAGSARLVDAKGAALDVAVTLEPIAGSDRVAIYAERRGTDPDVSLFGAVAGVQWTDAARATHTTPYTPPGG